MIPYWVFFCALFVVRIFGGSIDYRSIDYISFLISLTSLDTIVNPFYMISYYCSTDWFMGFIVIIYLLAPFIFMIYKKYNYKILILFFLISSVLLTQIPHQLIARIPFVQLLTFTLGIFLADINYRSFDLQKNLIVLLAIFSAFIAMYFIKIFTAYTLWLNAICFAAISFYLFKTLDDKLSSKFSVDVIKKAIYWGANLSFMFFLCHHQIIFYFKWYISNSGNQLIPFQGIGFVGLLAITIFLSWTLNIFANFFIVRIQTGAKF